MASESPAREDSRMNAENVIRFEETRDPAKSTSVAKLVDVEIDPATLLVSDTNELDLKAYRNNADKYLESLARDDAQLLINALWEYPTERYEDCIVAKLPPPKYVIPREKPVPQPKPLTRWEEFAKRKGIEPNKKKSNLTWDDVLKKWVPRFGYKKSAAEKEKDWLIEIPQSEDPYVDMFEKKAQVKSEKVSKNEFQRLRNIAKAKNVKVPSMGLPPTPKLNSRQLNSAAKIAHLSTASLGKFQPHSSKEKLLSRGNIVPLEKKRKLPVPSLEEERKRNLNIANSILNKKPKLDVDKVVNRQIHSEEVEASEQKQSKKRKGRGGGKKRRSKGHHAANKEGKKPKGGGGKRLFGGKGKQQSGRKRR